MLGGWRTDAKLHSDSAVRAEGAVRAGGAVRRPAARANHSEAWRPSRDNDDGRGAAARRRGRRAARRARARACSRGDQDPVPASGLDGVRPDGHPLLSGSRFITLVSGVGAVWRRDGSGPRHEAGDRLSVERGDASHQLSGHHVPVAARAGRCADGLPDPTSTRVNGGIFEFFVPCDPAVAAARGHAVRLPHAARRVARRRHDGAGRAAHSRRRGRRPQRTWRRWRSRDPI